jgi:FtsZ-interacting cell division protein ZipA
MWGITLRPCAVRLSVLASLLLLGGCATHREAAQAGLAPPPPAGERDATGAYRFNMTQNGRRMTADEFDAWMKARGIRVAKGAPAQSTPARATAQARTPGKAAHPKPAVATRTATAAPKTAAAKSAPTPAITAVTVAKPKAKPKPKPAVQEVSQAKAPVRQRSGEG